MDEPISIQVYASIWEVLDLVKEEEDLFSLKLEPPGLLDLVKKEVFFFLSQFEVRTSCKKGQSHKSDDDELLLCSIKTMVLYALWTSLDIDWVAIMNQTQMLGASVSKSCFYEKQIWSLQLKLMTHVRFD
jgi:hypothetical protein